MGCNCKKPDYNYVGKWALYGGDWYKIHTQDRIKGMLGIIYGEVLTWIRPSRIEAISDTQP
jgi:hypothetical protein